jgi:glycosyltransferase involved in cell wall biosynthesis
MNEKVCALRQSACRRQTTKEMAEMRCTTAVRCGISDWWPSFLFFLYSSALSLFVLLVFEPTSLFTLVFLELLTIGIAIDLSDYTCIAVIGKPLLPRCLEVIERKPSVALLMVVCDDLVLEALTQLCKQTYPNTTVFVLDDSIQDQNKLTVDRFGLTVLRRDNRCGAKAGNLNHWLREFGTAYDYFVVLDSDSILPTDFVERMLLYAEHPANQRIAVFNSLPLCWNRTRRFPRLLSSATPLRNWFRIRLENLDATTLSSGHNNLHRTSAVSQAGGFDENLIAEDIALSLTLLRHDYRSVLTDVHAFEAEPEHVFSFVRRQRRWASQTIQAASASWGPLPLSVRFRLFKLVWGYLTIFLYPVWFLVLAWGASSTWSDLGGVIALTTSHRWWSSITVHRVLFAPVLSMAMSAAIIPMLRASGVRVRDFALHLVFAWNLAFYSMFEVVAASARSLVGNQFPFHVTDKSARKVGLVEILRYQPFLVSFLVVVGLGLSQNVVSVVFAFPWLCLLFGCYFVVYWAHCDAQ